MSARVLMVAFHFPPAAMGSGHLRTLGFARYLPAYGWEPHILTANTAAYPRTNPIAPDSIPPGCRVHRALALDVSRQLSISGRYPGFLAQPDRWATWWFAAVASGLRIIRRRNIRAIWSTYPIMSAHRIAYTLHRLTKIPWIADFRDPVATSVEPGNPYSVASQQRWERRVLATAARSVFTTPSALRACAAQCTPDERDRRFVLIQNGYDEAGFANLPTPRPLDGRPLLLVHSGLLYTEGRNPMPFFNALATLKRSGALRSTHIHILLRACGGDDRYANALEQLGIGDLVSLGPPVTNRVALQEQARADGLLLFQGRRFDHQIPAKLYEYLRIGRPILALVSQTGDTEALLRQTGGAAIVAIDDTEAIIQSLLKFIHTINEGQAVRGDQIQIAGYSRERQTAALAQLFNEAAT